MPHNNLSAFPDHHQGNLLGKGESMGRRVLRAGSGTAAHTHKPNGTLAVVEIHSAPPD